MGWEPDLNASFVRRVADSPKALGNTTGTSGCPDIWELSNGDFAVIGRDLTDHYDQLLPPDAQVSAGERLVVVPRNMLASAKSELPNA